MGNNLTTMKFTVAALLIASTSAVQIQDDCNGKWCNKGLAYDFDEPTRNAAHADKVAKDHAFNGATKAHDDGAAGQAKSDTAGAFAGTSYKSPAYPGAEAAKNAAVVAKEASLDAHLKAFDDKVAKDLVEARKQRDLDAATAAKAAADAKLAANDARVAYEKDQLERGQNQDRAKEVNENTSAKTSEIQGKHDEREREPTADSSRLLLPSEHVLFEFNAKINKVKIF